MGFNTFPCNPYPISTEELNKGNNDDLNTRVSALESDVSDLNSNKANQITIAPFFNAETAYTAGDLVYYNGLIYRCTNDHEGEWDADDFAATTVSSELATLKNGLNDLTANQYGSIVDISSYTEDTFTFPSDGYVILATNTESSLVVRFYSRIGSSYFSVSSLNGVNVPMFVKKGMRALVKSTSGTSFTVEYYPLAV